MLTREQVIKRIKDLHKRRQPLNITAVKRNRPELIEAAFEIKPFWGWRNALKDAGISYDEINTELLDYVTCRICGKRLKTLSNHLFLVHVITAAEYLENFPREQLQNDRFDSNQSLKSLPLSRIPHWEFTWSREYVLDRLYYLYQREFSIYPSSLQKSEKYLYYRCLRYFGSATQALENIGVRLEKINRPFKYPSKQSVIKEIIRRKKEGLTLNSKAIARGYKQATLFNSAVRQFGSWRAALQAAGIPESYLPSRLRFTTKEAVITELKRRKAKGLTISSYQLVKGPKKTREVTLYNSGRKLFGSWRNALKAAGIPETQMRHLPKSYESQAAVIDEIKSRIQNGLTLATAKLRSGTFEQRNNALLNAGIKYFGSWKQTLLTAGVPESQWIQKRMRYPSKQSIVSEIKRRRKNNLTLSVHSVCRGPKAQRDATLYYSAKRHFGSWKNALHVAGALEDKLQKEMDRYPSEKTIISEIHRRREKNLDLRGIILRRGPSDQRDTVLYDSATQFFGSWEQALETARIQP